MYTTTYYQHKYIDKIANITPFYLIYTPTCLEKICLNGPSYRGKWLIHGPGRGKDDQL